MGSIRATKTKLLSEDKARIACFHAGRFASSAFSLLQPIVQNNHGHGSHLTAPNASGEQPPAPPGGTYRRGLAFCREQL